MGEELEIRAADERPYWETCTYTESNNIILGNLQTGQRAAIAIGYYLKHIRENKLYLDGGYQSFGEYVRAECGMSESTASRNIGRMEQFSEGGNSPKLADQWRDYGASQLQEIMYLTDEQREQVTPGMTVKEIREIRKPELVPEPDHVKEAPVEVVICEEVELEPDIVCEAVVEGEEPAEIVIVESSVEEMLPDMEEGACGPARCITGQSGSGFCGGAAYCSEPYTCCAQCSNDCNGRCGWLEESNKADDCVRDQMEYAVAATADPKIDFKALDQMISDTKNVQVDREEVATSQVAVVELVESDCFYDDVTDKCPPMSRECENAVDVCCEDCMEQWCPTRCKHAKVPDGVELYEECSREEVVKEVPSMPVLKNNEQRQAWLSDYKAWGLWYRDENIDVNYYKFDFPDGSRLIVAEYPQREQYWSIDKRDEAYYHLLHAEGKGKGKETSFNSSFVHQSDSMTHLVEYLRSLQKGVKA